MICVAIRRCGDGPEARHKAGRELLADMTAPLIKEPADGEIITSPHGKPAAKSGRYGFSISHSGGFVCCAVASREALCFENADFVLFMEGETESAVGADIEVFKEKEPSSITKIANRFFSEEERAFVGNDPLRFFETHTKKEALCKLTGEGLSGYRLASGGEQNGKKTETRIVDFGDKRVVLSVAFFGAQA